MPDTRLPFADRPALYIIHDNPEWIPPFATALEAEGVDFTEWLLPGRVLDLSADPPEGVFWSRLSASSHTRTDPRVKEYARAVLTWLEAAGRTVINGSAVYELEVSKIRQHRELERRGFDVPRTVAAFGHENLVRAAAGFVPPFITKHNQGGKGLGVRRFQSHAELEAAIHEFAHGGQNEPIDGITLVQEYLSPVEPFITRAEFIDGVFHYAVRVDVSGGSFELCPAEACEISQPSAPPVMREIQEADGVARDGTGGRVASGAAPQFRRREEINAETPLVVRLQEMLRELGVRLAGVEFIETADGRQTVYDINTNTNYNPEVEHGERAAGRVPAAQLVARFLGSLVG